MYKWQALTTAGRSRSLPADVAKVTDGIASSLRQFHISAASAAEEKGNRPPKPRSQRSAEAAAEILASTPSKPRGIDARSLAAQIPQGQRFVIRRVDHAGGGRGRGLGGRPFRGRASSRGGPRGGLARGGPAGRGGFRGRGRGARGGSGRGGQQGVDISPDMAKMEPIEQAYIDGVEQGLPTPYPITTKKEALDNLAPGIPLSSTNLGIVDTIRSRIVAITKQPFVGQQTAQRHHAQYQANGTLFPDSEERDRVLASPFLVPKHIKDAEKLEDALVSRTFGEIETLNEAERAEILQKFAVGTYEPPKVPTIEDPRTSVESYATKNKTYLPKDGEMLRARVQDLLPASQPSNAPKRARAS